MPDLCNLLPLQHETTRIDLNIHRRQGRISRAHVRQTISRARIILLLKAGTVVHRIHHLLIEVSQVVVIQDVPISQADLRVLRVVEADPPVEEADLQEVEEASPLHRHREEEDKYTTDTYYITAACRSVHDWSAS